MFRLCDSRSLQENGKGTSYQNVCSFYSGGTPSSSKKEYYNGNIPFIRSGELHKDYTELFITEAGLSNSAAIGGNWRLAISVIWSYKWRYCHK